MNVQITGRLLGALGEPLDTCRYSQWAIFQRIGRVTKNAMKIESSMTDHTNQSMKTGVIVS